MRLYREGPESEHDAILRAVVNHDLQIFQKFVYRAIYDTPHSQTAFFDLDCDDMWETILNEGKRSKQFFFYNRRGDQTSAPPLPSHSNFLKPILYSAWWTNIIYMIQWLITILDLTNNSYITFTHVWL